MLGKEASKLGLLFGIFIIMPLLWSRIRSTDTYLDSLSWEPALKDVMIWYCAWSTTIRGISNAAAETFI